MSGATAIPINLAMSANEIFGLSQDRNPWNRQPAGIFARIDFLTSCGHFRSASSKRPGQHASKVVEVMANGRGKKFGKDGNRSPA